MKASRMSMAAAGALLAVAFGMLAPSGAIAGTSVARVSFHGAAPMRAGGFHAPFNHAAAFDRRSMRRRGRGDFGGFDGTGAVLDEPSQEESGAPTVQVAAYLAPAAQQPGALAWEAALPAGPKIIEIGRHAPRRVHWPVVVYGDR